MSSPQVIHPEEADSTQPRTNSSRLPAVAATHSFDPTGRTT
jgi:hypothetical protein